MLDVDRLSSEITSAIYEHDRELVTQLIAQDPTLVKRNKGGTFLHDAVGAQSADLTQLLLDLGSDINAGCGSDKDETPIMHAIMNDLPDILQMLLQNGADPKCANPKLTIGAIVGPKRRSLEMVKILESFGCDLHQVFQNEQTNRPMNALSCAIDWGKKNVEAYLRSKGARLPDESLANDEVLEATLVDDLETEVVAYFRQHFGPPEELSLIEIVPSGIPIGIRCIPAAADRKHITLFTVGMCNHLMTVPAGMEQYARAEIYIQLPENWQVRELGDPEWSWPQHWLRSLAQYPADNDTWLGGAVALVANGDPPEPLAPNTKLTTLLLMAERVLVGPAGEVVQLYRMSPLYTEERDLEIAAGLPALLNAFDRENISFIVDVQRKNVAT
ncbi:suppressor of fused domain protein [Anatilimnocola sp. NA78]|uniref:suppressor of fused domain protein n=1 Tax=Anatilimnocola sp. NA78 TaxID=3415683 RepID=UPI003CE4E382